MTAKRLRLKQLEDKSRWHGQRLQFQNGMGTTVMQHTQLLQWKVMRLCGEALNGNKARRAELCLLEQRLCCPELRRHGCFRLCISLPHLAHNHPRQLRSDSSMASSWRRTGPAWQSHCDVRPNIPLPLAIVLFLSIFLLPIDVFHRGRLCEGTSSWSPSATGTHTDKAIRRMSSSLQAMSGQQMTWVN